MEIDYVTVDLLFGVMLIGDGARLIPRCKVWIIFHQSSMAGNGQMDAAGLKMLRWLSVTGNGHPPCSWNKMLADLKRLRSSQGVCDSVSTRCHNLHIQKQTPSWLKAHCVCDVTTASLQWAHNGVAKHSSAAKRAAAHRYIRRTEKALDELPYSQVTPLDGCH